MSLDYCRKITGGILGNSPERMRDVTRV